MKIEKILYQAHATVTGGRDGHAVSSDRALEIDLSIPKELGGAGGSGTNPEQLFAAGYAACFIGAMKFVAMQKKMVLPAETFINSSVGIGAIPGGFGIEVTLEIHLPGIDQAAAEDLIQAANLVCPYSNATRNNIEVQLKIVV